MELQPVCTSPWMNSEHVCHVRKKKRKRTILHALSSPKRWHKWSISFKPTFIQNQTYMPKDSPRWKKRQFQSPNTAHKSSAQPVPTTLVIFVNIHGGLNHKIMPQRHTVSGEFYCNIQKQLRKSIWGKLTKRLCVASCASTHWWDRMGHSNSMWNQQSFRYTQGGIQFIS